MPRESCIKDTFSEDAQVPILKFFDISAGPHFGDFDFRLALDVFDETEPVLSGGGVETDFLELRFGEGGRSCIDESEDRFCAFDERAS